MPTAQYRAMLSDGLKNQPTTLGAEGEIYSLIMLDIYIYSSSEQLGSKMAIFVFGEKVCIKKGWFLQSFQELAKMWETLRVSTFLF